MRDRIEKKITTHLVSAYLKNDDMTIIIEHIYEDDEIIKTEIKGFYFGTPSEENTNYFKDKGCVCNYE